MDKDCKISPENPYWDLIQEAYSVFRVPIPQDLEVCNMCCMPDEQQDVMKQYVSQNIPLHLVREWYSAATNYPVSQNLWLYILPRTLEILAIGENPTHSLEIALSRYPAGERKNWNEAQWQVLDTFQKKFIQTDMSSYSSSPHIWVTSFWKNPEETELKWSAKILRDRLFDYGMAADSPKHLSDQALDLVDVISMYKNDWDNN